MRKRGRSESRSPTRLDGLSPVKKRKLEDSEAEPETRHTHVVQLGGRKVNAFGLGTLALGVTYCGRPEEEEAVKVIHAAIDAGCELIDTADTYCRDRYDLHYIEKVVARALASHPKGESVVVATKGGMVRINDQSNGWREARQQREDIHRMINESHAALGGQKPIYLWQLHHVNTGRSPDAEELARRTVEVMQAAMELVAEGKVLHLGLCNATVKQIDACMMAGIPLVSVQVKYSPFARTIEKPLPSNRAAGKTSQLGVLDACGRYGLTVIAYAPLGGLPIRQGKVSLTDKCKTLVPVAERLDVSLHALVLAVLRERCPFMAFITGARTPAHATDSIATPPTLHIDDEIAELL